MKGPEFMLLHTKFIAPMRCLAAALAVLALTAGSRAEDGHLSGRDPAVAPGEDFFRHANGGWLDTTPIPPDRDSYGVSGIVFDLTSRRTADLIRDAAGASPAPGTPARQVADYYASFMDEATIESKGLKPLQPTIHAIAAIADRRQLARFLGGALRADVDAFNATNFYTDNLFGLWVAQDLEDPTRYTPFLLQGGLDMPQRDYYLDETPRMVEIRGKYRAHVAAVLKLGGVERADDRAAAVFDLETRIARAHASRAESEDVRSGLNRWPRAAFDAKATGLDWAAFFSAAGLAAQREFVVWQPGAVTGIAALVGSEPLETWKAYLTFHALERWAAVLPDAFGRERFAFHGTVLRGVPERQERWKRGVDATNLALGEAVGRMYVERYFPASEKARAEAMVRNIMAAFSRRIDTLAWMSPATKAKAKAKLGVLKVGVGYPDAWTDHSSLQIVPDDLLGNSMRAERFAYERRLSRLGRPVDRGEWVMSPQTVNAVNLPAMNAMNFPAAILQPPYFDASRPSAMDYGAIGAVIGHEVSHSFDDAGALFDDAGRLSNWWTDEDKKHFDAAAAQLVKQYDAYQPFPDAHLDGTLTLGENIADVAGLAAAYDAWRLSLGGGPAPVVDGLTGDQQFFISYGQSWRRAIRETALRAQVLGDAHAPDEYRVLTVRNVDAWYEAFGVTPGQRLYLDPGERVRMW